MARKHINAVRTVHRTVRTGFTVELQVVHVSAHTRAFSNKIFGNEFFVNAYIPELDASANLAGPFRTREEALEMLAEREAEMKVA